MIVKLKDNAYVEWSSCTDSPVSYVMDKAEMIEFVKDQQLRQMHLRPGELEAIEDPRLRQLKQELFDREVNNRLERIEKNGTSSMIGHTLGDFLSFNRAGKGGSHVKTAEELIEIYTYTPEKKEQ
jgi:hypothetical protein